MPRSKLLPPIAETGITPKPDLSRLTDKAKEKYKNVTENVHIDNVVGDLAKRGNLGAKAFKLIRELTYMTESAIKGGPIVTKEIVTGYPQPHSADFAAKVLKANKGKNFVDRLFDPKAPKIQNEDGSFSTHLMASSEEDGAGVVYPTIIQDPKTKKLQKLSPEEALRYAHKTGEFIGFGNPKDADWFAANGYKLGVPGAVRDKSLEVNSPEYDETFKK